MGLSLRFVAMSNFLGEADSAKGQTVSGGGQTGTFSKPYNGVNSEKYFITPHQFFYDDKKSGNCFQYSRHFT